MKRLETENGSESKHQFRSVVIFGGAGFIGSQWAAHLLANTDAKVHVVDNLSRLGVRHNLNWLEQRWLKSGRLRITIGDVRDAKLVSRVVRSATEVYHLAAQVAVTTSLADPRHDFETNALGTFNVMEAARESGRRPFVLFTSTNKVYGELKQHEIAESASRYEFRTSIGVNEEQPLDFYSPYGCSKGAAEQYVRDYARIYGIPTVVFRMSCIAGARQFGNEDQGWVAHFLYSILNNFPLTIYGTGKQVRDVLNVRDLIRAFEAAHENVAITRGHVYNVGGGMGNSVSLVELLSLIGEFSRSTPVVHYAPARTGDQLVYVSNYSKLEHHTGWRPQLTVRETLAEILQWHNQNRALFKPSAEPMDVPAGLEAVPRAA